MASKRDLYSDYGIPVFYDNSSGEMILRDSKEFFEGNQSLSPDVRRDHLLKIRSELSHKRYFLCGHCLQPVYISGRSEPHSGQKRLHFQHFRNDAIKECIFHDGQGYTKDEIKRMIFNGRQESREHKALKKIIRECFIPWLGADHVLSEPTLHGNDGGWRRPDIYVEFPDKALVFEIQLTYIFLSDINERNRAHRENDRFVIWIFKDFGDGEGSTLDSERLSKLDIFAANNFNAFVLDEEAQALSKSSGRLHLTVYYRDYSNIHGQTTAQLGKALVAFDNLTFDEERKLIYYFDSEAKLSCCIAELEDQQKLEDEKLR